jgi:hypothetical protein
MPSAYFQTYTLKKNDDVSTTQTVDVTSWAAALDGTLNAGFILLAMEIWYGQNLSSYGIDFRSSGTKESTTMGAPVANAQGNDLKNVNSAGGWFQIGIPIKPVTIYAGYGYQQSQVKRTNSATIAYNSNISTQGVYANVKWAVTKGFYIQPEVVYFDNGNDAQKTLTNPSGSVYSAGDNNLGGDIWAGIHFQYDF